LGLKPCIACPKKGEIYGLSLTIPSPKKSKNREAGKETRPARGMGTAQSRWDQPIKRRAQEMKRKSSLNAYMIP